VHPRLETLVGRTRTAEQPAGRLSTGITGLDAMLGGGLLPGTSTLLLGTPGAGKTNTGLQFVTAGLAAGERGLIATFHEDAARLADTVAGVELRRAMDDGQVEVFWQAPLETSPDAWAWDLLGRVERHRAQRLFIDGLSDVHRFHRIPERVPAYLAALTNELRRRRVTVVGTVEIDAFVAPELTTPIPAMSAMVDNGILLRQVEIRSRLRRLVSVLKARQSETDPAIREFRIEPGGVEIGELFHGAAALLTGAALPEPRTEPGLSPAATPS